uniref:Putative zinc finger CCHC domain-containing protein n=1 Tax=Noccaea caerulescens TaxID=107243 RepID=A0A1J3IXK9_NOCCA
MDGEEGSGIRLSKRFADGKVTGGLEVDYKTKSGTAWSHSFLNQKPWHPLSYPNQRRKWIAEQTHAQHDRRAEEVAREFAQEQEFFKQAALISKKEREKIEMMKAVSFMYIRPPGYDPESAKAAEYASEKHEGQSSSTQDPMADDNVGSKPSEAQAGSDLTGKEKKKPRPKDVFGRTLPTEEEFDVLKNAPRLETGIAGRAKPFGVELRNVKCLRCGNFGHQSGDRDCPLKDAVMPNEELRLKRDDPLTAIIAHTDPGEPLKWELKQKPGLSPPRGGFDPDDPNQQIVAEDIFDEYGGFLEGSIPLELLRSMSSDKKRKSKKNKNHKKHSSRTVEETDESSTGSEDSRDKRGSKKRNKPKKSKKHYDSESLSSEDSDSDNYRPSRSRHNKHLDSSGAFISEINHQGNSQREKHYDDEKHQKRKKMVDMPSASSDDSDYYRKHSNRKKRSEDDYKSHHRERKQVHKNNLVSEKSQKPDSLESGKLHRVDKKQGYDERRHRNVDVESEKRHRSNMRPRYDDRDSERHHRSVKGKEKHVYDASDDPEGFSDRYRSTKKSESDSESNRRSRKKKQTHELSSEEEEEKSNKHRYSTNRRRN